MHRLKNIYARHLLLSGCKKNREDLVLKAWKISERSVSFLIDGTFLQKEKRDVGIPNPGHYRKGNFISPLFMATKCGSDKVVEFLLKSDIHPNSRQYLNQSVFENSYLKSFSPCLMMANISRHQTSLFKP